MTVDTASFNAMLRELDWSPEINNLIYKNRPMFAMLPKKEDSGGSFIPNPIGYGSSQGRSAGFARAQLGAARTGSVAVKMQLTLQRNYQLIQWDNLTLEQSKSDKGAFVTARKFELDATRNNISNDIATALYKNGTGSRGSILNPGGISGATITLSTIQDVYNFEVGMEIMLAAAEASGTTRAVGTSTNGLFVTAVNRNTGVVTFNANVTDATNGIPTAAVGDFIFQRGDRNESGAYAALKPQGLLGWLPATAPTGGDSFFGVDRSVDPVRLAGNRVSAVGLPIEEALLNASQASFENGGRADKAFIHPGRYNDLVKSLGSRIQYCEVKPDNVSFGFRGIEIEGQAGTLQVFSDPNCPYAYGFVLQLDTFLLHSLGRCPRLLPVADGIAEGQVTLPAADGLEVRMGTYYQLGCNAPGYSATILF